MDESTIVEIEKVLGAEAGDTRGQQIGKALNYLQNLQNLGQLQNLQNPGQLQNLGQNAASVLIEEIQNVLKADKAPENASEVAKLFHSLKQFAKEQDDPLHKAYMGYAKNAAAAYATCFNAINIFGTTMSYVIGVDGSKKIKNNPRIRGVFICLTFAFLPITLLTVGMAHALEHRLHWKNWVSVMLMFEVVYMAVMSILFGVYLLPSSNTGTAIFSVCGVAGLFLIAVPWCLFKTPTDALARCRGNVEVNGGEGRRSLSHVP